MSGHDGERAILANTLHLERIISDLERQLAETRAEIAELKKAECNHVTMRLERIPTTPRGATTEWVVNLHCPLCGERLVSE